MHTCTPAHAHAPNVMAIVSCLLFSQGVVTVTLLFLRSTPGKAKSPLPSLGPALLVARGPPLAHIALPLIRLTRLAAGRLCLYRQWPQPDHHRRRAVLILNAMWQGHSFKCSCLVRGCQINNFARCSIYSLISPKVVVHICLVSSVFTWDILTDPRTNFLLESYMSQFNSSMTNRQLPGGWVMQSS